MLTPTASHVIPQDRLEDALQRASPPLGNRQVLLEQLREQVLAPMSNKWQTSLETHGTGQAGVLARCRASLRRGGGSTGEARVAAAEEKVLKLAKELDSAKREIVDAQVAAEAAQAVAKP